MGRVEVHDPADGGVLEVEVADVLTLLLPQNATTGHVWRARPPGAGLFVVSEDDLAGATDPGASGWHRLVLTAVEPGDWPVELLLGRPWEDSPVDVRHLGVTVR